MVTSEKYRSSLGDQKLTMQASQLKFSSMYAKELTGGCAGTLSHLQIQVARSSAVWGRAQQAPRQENSKQKILGKMTAKGAHGVFFPRMSRTGTPCSQHSLRAALPLVQTWSLTCNPSQKLKQACQQHPAGQRVVAAL